MANKVKHSGVKIGKTPKRQQKVFWATSAFRKRKREKQGFPPQSMENLTSFPLHTHNSNTEVSVVPEKCPQDKRSCDHQDDLKSFKSMEEECFLHFNSIRYQEQKLQWKTSVV